MEIRRWNFSKGYEDYKILYEDKDYILVQNIKTGKYSFGLVSDFGSFYGFGVDESCLTKDECIKRINQFIEIDKKYIDTLPYIIDKINVWKSMIEILENIGGKSNDRK